MTGPKAYPPSAPLEAMTLWQGMRRGKGLCVHACPTALAARGDPLKTATSL